MDLMYNYFVLGYNAINYFEQWYDFDQFQNTNLRIIDNGRQTVSNKLNPYIIHVNKQNIGCPAYPNSKTNKRNNNTIVNKCC